MPSSHDANINQNTLVLQRVKWGTIIKQDSSYTIILTACTKQLHALLSPYPNSDIQ